MRCDNRAMHRVADTTLLIARAGGTAGLVAAACWPALLAGLWWGLALARTAPGRPRHGA